MGDYGECHDPGRTASTGMTSSGALLRPTVEELDLGPEAYDRALDALRNERDFALLDSRSVDGRLGRYSFACFEPFASLAARGGEVAWEEPGRGVREVQAGRFLDALELRLACYRAEPAAERALPFSGGAVGYLGYELARQIEASRRAITRRRSR